MTYIMQPYDDALKYIVENGERRSNRTGIDTLSVFGMQTRYRIDEHFPILTKRKMFYKSIFAELLWMLSGSTDVNDLEALGSKIWTAWRDKEFETKHGYADGKLGPIYGWQMRHFGADYSKWRHTFPPGEEGFDQVKYVVNELKTNKTSRRIIMNLWNAPDVCSDKVRLPPCHVMFQLSVDNKDRLSGMLTQRSCDKMPGAPANVQFYSAFIYMLAQQCGFIPYEFIHSMGDAHIYVNQLEAVEEYLARPEIPSPKLKLNNPGNIFAYTLNDYEIIDYNPGAVIKVPVAV